MLENYIDSKIKDIARQQAKAMDDAIIRFLRRHGYKPRRTEKYAKNLSKRLAKKVLILNVKEIILEEKFTETSYYKKIVYIPSFVDIKNRRNK